MTAIWTKMKALVGYLKWLPYAILAGAGAFAVLVLRSMFTGVGKGGSKDPVPKPPAALVQAEIVVHEQAEVKDSQANTIAAVQTAELQQVEKVGDGVERRKELAELIKGS